MRIFEVSLARKCRAQVSEAICRGRAIGACSPMLRRMRAEEDGQVIPWVVLLLVLFLGMCAITVDIGHAMLVKRQLQVAVDAVALAAAETMPKTNYQTVGTSYGGAKGETNAIGGGVTVAAPTFLPKCLTTVAGWGIPCTSTSPNAIAVTETATVPTFFAGILGIKTIDVAASAMASKGSKPLPLNVAIILDTTPSMDTYDNNCGATQLQCATAGVQQLLAGLNPSEDKVSLFTFPNIDASTVSQDYDCNSSSSPTAEPYTFPSATATKLSNMPYTTGSGRSASTVQVTYQVTGFLTDYRTSDTATSLNSSSNLAAAVGKGTGTKRGGCTGMQTSYENTYYAGAIYAAQSALLAAQTPGTQNVIILLSDGNATGKEGNPGGAASPGYNDFVSGSQSTTVGNSSGTYPSWVAQCSQGVDAAQYAGSYAGNNTTVFTISYGSPSTSSSGNCGSDRTNSASHKNITPCQAMQQMSSGWNSGDHSHFYSDYYAPGGDSGCQAADQNNTITSLNNIFSSILSSLESARLIPTSTT